MTAQDNETNGENYLPREPLDLPKEPLDLPQPHEELPADEDDTTQHQVKTLISWSAPGRPFKKRGKEFYLSSLLILLLVEILLFLFSQYMLMLVALSFVFVSFALVTVPPHNFHYKISTEGIQVEDHFYLWQELYDFYFKHKHGTDVLYVRTQVFFPGALVITLGDVHKEQVKNILSQFLPYREYVKPTLMEKSGTWLSKNFPLEKEEKQDASQLGN